MVFNTLYNNRLNNTLKNIYLAIFDIVLQYFNNSNYNNFKITLF